MNTYRRDIVTPRAIQLNQNVVEDHVDDAYYVKRFGPDAFHLFINTAASARVGTGTHSGINFPNAGALPAAFLEFERPSLWLAGNLQLSFTYTGSTSSTSTVFLLGNVACAVAGSNLDVGGTVITTLSLPGPATAWDEKSYNTATQLYSIDGSHRSVGIKLVRNTADAYAGDWYLLGMTVRFIPSRKSA